MGVRDFFRPPELPVIRRDSARRVRHRFKVRISHPPHSTSLIAHTRLTLVFYNQGDRGCGPGLRQRAGSGEENTRRAAVRHGEVARVY